MKAYTRTAKYTNSAQNAKDYVALLHFLNKIAVQCNLDLVTLLVAAKTVTKSHNVTKSNDFM